MRRENATLEYKEKVSSSFLKTVSAFANYEGGQILFGVSDDGEPIGVADPFSSALSIENSINDAIDPVPPYSIHVNETTKIIVLSVNPGDDPPYRYKGKAYCRHDSATVEVDRPELNRLVLRGGGQAFESLPATAQSLAFSMLEQKLKDTLGISSFGSDVMRSLGLMDVAGLYNRAAELFADENPYPGTDIARFGASEDEINERIGCSNASLFAQYDQALMAYRRYYQQEVIDGPQRRLRELVPELAFREALINGVVHRTWDTHAHLQIAMHPEKIIITSPGGLPYGITEDEYLHKEISVLRNPLVADVFFRLGYIERFGTGVQRIVRAYRDANTAPSFSISANTLQITLPVIGLAGSSDENTVLSLVKEGGLLSHSDLVLATGFNKSKVSRILAALVARGALERVGVGRGTKYRLP